MKKDDAQCPACGSRSVARILYGLPGFDDEMQGELDSGRLALGGCCITGYDPNRHCNACGHSWKAGRRAGTRRSRGTRTPERS